jgi:tRNA A-37 threonylcarbamoyl transferase component Bud32
VFTFDRFFFFVTKKKKKKKKKILCRLARLVSQMGQKETKTRLKMPNDDATSTSSGGGGKKSSSGGNGAAASATSPAVEKVEKTNSSGEIKKKSDKSSSTNGSSGGGGGGGDKKASRKDKKEAKAARRGKVSDKVAAQVEELERDGVGEGELVFNSTPGVKVTRDDFELMTLIGKGSFGKVMQVRKRDTQQIYAMKVLRKEAIIARKQVTHTQAEKAILAKIQHPFIVKLHYAFQTKEKLYMILDYINGGELFFHLKREGRFPEERVRFYAAEIISAISHLHSLDIVYRDLKPENILLDRDGHVVITDFGLSKEIDQDEGTHTFCVPEDHQLLTSRGFMDLDTYRAESARDHSLLVAGYDARAKTLLFEAPHRLVEYASATRTLVELESADAADAVSMLVTPDHDLVAQLGECTPSRKFVPRQQSADYAKVKASELLAGKHGAVRQLAVADAGVGERADAPQIAELGLADDDDKAARFYELYGLVLGGAVAERRGVLRFDNVSADARQWLCETFELLGAGVVSGVVVRIADAAWQRALCDSIDGERVFASWVWRLGTSALRAVLRGLIRADESASSVSVSSSSTVFTSSAALRDEIVRLALMAGYSAHFACAGGADSAVSWAISFAESSSRCCRCRATRCASAPTRVAFGASRCRRATCGCAAFTPRATTVW